MKSAKLFVAVVALAFVTSNVVNAQEEAKKECPSTCSKATSAVATVADESDCAKCPVTAAMEKLPKLVYKVGDESTCCSKSAKEMAKKVDETVQYVVGKKSFEKEELAYVSLVEQTEAFVKGFVTPSKCETSGKTTIAGESCSCPIQAGEKTKLVKKAVDKIKMTYVVGEKECACPNEAKKLAETSKEKTTYVVGDAKTCCNYEARLNLARAKYKAAVQALASTAKPADKKAEKSGT